jgi:hypothetical protein
MHAVIDFFYARHNRRRFKGLQPCCIIGGGSGNYNFPIFDSNLQARIIAKGGRNFTAKLFIGRPLAAGSSAEANQQCG